MGKPIVMGRRTWESIGRPLPGRQNVVMTRTKGYSADGAEVVDTPDAAIDLLADCEEIMIIGGGQVYGAFVERASKVYLTRVDVALDGDTFFPALGNDWVLESREPHAIDERHAYAFEFQVYCRR